MTPGPGIEPGTHWWKASALTTTPTLLPITYNKLLTEKLILTTSLKSLESTVNQELSKLFDWLTANKLTLNIKKTSFVIFRPAQRKLNYHPKIMIFDNDQNKNVALECKESVRYLGCNN